MFTDDSGHAWLKVPGAMVREDYTDWPAWDEMFPVSTPLVDATPPAGARLYFADDAGRPCSPAAAFMWCWEGGGQWFHARDYPVPGAAEVAR